MRQTKIVCLFVAVSCFWQAPASAQDRVDEANETGSSQEASDAAQADQVGRAAFERGRIAFDAGDYEAALVAFSEAFELTGRPELQYNVGLSQDRLRMDEEAIASFESYLEAVPDSPFEEQVTGRIEALRQAVTRRENERARLEAERTEAQAQAAAASAAAASASEARPSRWWIGVIVGVVVIGAGVGLAVGLTREGDAFAPSDFGGTSYTLGSF